ncbi:hypothetical protein BD770DRAFT_399065 [Pilaira anomala]|nr:hypothetical protein BD770DRAFT_399065 [Pilaira anomala]
MEGWRNDTLQAFSCVLLEVSARYQQFFQVNSVKYKIITCVLFIHTEIIFFAFIDQ